MTALAVLASVVVVVAGALLAFRWWLDARNATTPELETRLAALEQWKTRAEVGKLR